MKFTTLCYIEDNDKVLMLYRNKKENDLNAEKWIGVGGKFKEKESPDECVIREVKEETGLILTKFKLRCLVTFVSDKWETEQMFVYTATDFTGTLKECDEGELYWIDKEKLLDLPTWEGDKLFLERIKNDEEFFTMRLEYKKNKLIKSK